MESFSSPFKSEKKTTNRQNRHNHLIFMDRWDGEILLHGSTPDQYFANDWNNQRFHPAKGTEKEGKNFLFSIFDFGGLGLGLIGRMEGCDTIGSQLSTFPPSVRSQDLLYFQLSDADGAHWQFSPTLISSLCGSHFSTNFIVVKKWARRCMHRLYCRHSQLSVLNSVRA